MKVYYLLMAIAFAAVINIPYVNADVTDDFSAVYASARNGNDVHMLDHFVSGRTAEYLNCLRERFATVTDAPAQGIANLFQEVKDFTVPFITGDDFSFMAPNGGMQPLNHGQAVDKFTAAINHLRHLHDTGGNRFGSADTTELLLANYNIRRALQTSVNADMFADYMRFFIEQMLDAQGTCLQGQTNRLLLALHHLTYTRP